MATISRFKAQKNLTIYWLFFSFIVSGWLIIWTVNGYFDKDIDTIWDWILQLIGPTFTLILTGFIVLWQSGARSRQRQIDSFFYWMAIGISTCFMLVIIFILGSLVVNNFYQESNPETIFKKTKTFFSLFQTALSAVLGIFFVKGEH